MLKPEKWVPHERASRRQARFSKLLASAACAGKRYLVLPVAEQHGLKLLVQALELSGFIVVVTEDEFLVVWA